MPQVFIKRKVSKVTQSSFFDLPRGRYQLRFTWRTLRF